MATEYVIRCTLAETGESYRVRDTSSEVAYFPNIDMAIAEAMEMQDATCSDVHYTVEAA